MWCTGSDQSGSCPGYGDYRWAWFTRLDSVASNVAYSAKSMCGLGDEFAAGGRSLPNLVRPLKAHALAEKLQEPLQGDPYPWWWLPW